MTIDFKINNESVASFSDIELSNYFMKLNTFGPKYKSVGFQYKDNNLNIEISDDLKIVISDIQQKVNNNIIITGKNNE